MVDFFSDSPVKSSRLSGSLEVPSPSSQAAQTRCIRALPKPRCLMLCPLLPMPKPIKIKQLNRICWATMMSVNARTTRVAFIALAAVGSSGAFSPSFPLPHFSTSTSSVRIPFKSSAVLTQTRRTLVPRRRHRHVGQKERSHAGLFLFGFGEGGGSSASSRSGAPASSRARKAVESNAVFKSRTQQVCGTRNNIVAAHGGKAVVRLYVPYHAHRLTSSPAATHYGSSVIVDAE